MSFKKILVPALVLGALYTAACGSSDAAIGDSASGGSAGTSPGSAGTLATGGSAGSGTASGGAGGGCVGVHECPAIACAPGGNISTPAGECCPVCSSGSGGSSASAGAPSAGGAGGGCTGIYNCPAIVCTKGTLSTPVGECCPVCSGDSGGASSGGVSGVSGAAGAGGCPQSLLACPTVLTICKAGESPIPPGHCGCPTCVPAPGTAGAGGSK
jgi:hypothetical protein